MSDILTNGRPDMAPGIDTGLLKEVTEAEGTGLVGDHAAGVTVLSVAAGGFRDVGTCRVNDVDYAYVRDDDTDTLTITPALAALAEDGTPVLSLTPTGAAETTLVAVVDLDMAGDPEDDVRAVIPGELAGFYPAGTAAAGSLVRVRDTAYGYEVASRPVDAPGLTGVPIQTVGETARGIEIDPSQNGGYGSLTAYDDLGEPTFNLNGQTGSVQMKGTLEAGSAISGAAIAVAAGTAGSFAEEFAGTAFPAGWVNEKTRVTNASVKASVVSTGPTGQNGSAILVDFGPAGLMGVDAGRITTTLPEGTMQTATVRFRNNAYRDTVPDRDRMEEAALCLRTTDGWNEVAEGEAVYIDLIPRIQSSSFRFAIKTGGGFTGLPRHVGDYWIPLSRSVDPTKEWCWASLRLEGDVAYAKVWAESEPEPPWQVYPGVALSSAPGTAVIGWEHWPAWAADDLSRGVQKVWIDHFSAESFISGFIVNPDGTGEWPAIGLHPGDATWHTVGNTGEPAFANGWTEFSADSVKFRKFPTGDVTINADVNIPAGGNITTIFTLPATHRPTATYDKFYAWQNDTTHLSNIRVTPDGAVRWDNAGSAGGTRAIFSVSFSTL